MSLGKTYENEIYEIRLKAPILWTTSLVLMIAGLGAAVNSLINNFMIIDFCIFIVLSILQAVTLILIHKKHYQRGALVNTITLLAGLNASSWISGYEGAHTLGFTSAMFIMMLLFALTFLLKDKHVWLAIGFVSVSFYAFLAVALIRGQVEPSGITPALTLVLNSILVFTLSIVFLLFLRHIFSKMIKDMSKQLEIVKAREERLKQITSGVSEQLEGTASLVSVIEQTADGTLQMERNIQSITEQMARLSDEYRESGKALKDIEQSLSVLDNNSEDQASNINQTSASVEEMVASISSVNTIIEARKAVVDDLEKAAVSGSTIMEQTIDSFEKVASRIDSIREMTEFISSVADQTNLLAMNAAIEAAHAGDSGRGFAVVADEVRKLAESSSENAKQINAVLGELLGAIAATGENVNKTGSAFKTIRTGIGDVDTAMDEIAGSIKELSLGSGEILGATGSMNHLTRQVFDGIKDLNRETGTVKNSVDSVGTILDKTVSSMSEIMQGTKSIRESMLSVLELAQKVAGQAETLQNSGDG